MRTILELKDITLKRGENYIIKGINLRIIYGEKIALMGPSGAGKSSLISISNGSIKPSYGIVKWKNIPIEKISLDNKRLIATIWQELRLVEELNVRQNINTGVLSRKSILWGLLNLLIELESEKCLKFLKLVDLPSNLLNKSIKSLSGGERQRVAIARTFRQGAEILFADEPLSNLDPKLTEKILDLLLGKIQTSYHINPKSVMISLHRPELVGDFTRIIGIKNGEILIDKPKVLVKQSDINNLYA
tara:strand:- start:732 stop:1469 length:738 start_codon:yes stop_codon:yes gene_type:complete